MTKYNEAQTDFRDKSKGRIARQLEISESDASRRDKIPGITRARVFVPGQSIVRKKSSPSCIKS